MHVRKLTCFVTSQKGQGDTEGLGDDEAFDDHFMEMDWGDEEEEKPRESPNIFEERTKSSLAREKSEAEKPKNKFAEIMAKPPTPQVLRNFYSLKKWDY